MNHKSIQSASGSGFTGWEEQPQAPLLGTCRRLSWVCPNLCVPLKCPQAPPAVLGHRGAEPGVAPRGTAWCGPSWPWTRPAAPPEPREFCSHYKTVIKGSTSCWERNCRSFSQRSGFLMPPESVIRFSRLRNNYITNVNNINIPKTKYDLNTFGWYKRKTCGCLYSFYKVGIADVFTT